MQFHWVGMRRTSGLSTTQLSFAMAATVLAIGSLLALLLLQSYRDRYREAGQNVINIATLLSEDIRQEIQGLDLSLRAAVDGWRDERVGSLNKSLQKMVLFDRSANRQEAGSIFIAGPDGQFLLESGSDEPRRFSVDDRGYFQSHRELPEAGLIVSGPLRSRLNNDWLLSLSRRLNNPDGSFGGVVVASIRLNHFREKYSRVSIGPAGALGLVSFDGQLVLRQPDIGDLIGRSEPQRLPFQVVGRASGTYGAVSRVDGVHRIYAFHRIGTLPYVQLVAVSKQEVFADWWSRTYLILAGFAVLSGIVALLTAAFVLELKRRAAAEAELVTAARTDSLTGLGNRRRLDEALQNEWQKTLRNRETFALLMIDIDHFKAFNDRYGHTAGDAALSQIGAVFKRNLRCGLDVGVRYGGEEFCIILPDTTLDPAMKVARSLHRAVAELGIAHEGAARNMLTVSIGVAAGSCTNFASPVELMACADAALYRAKNGGRNLTVAADLSEPKKQAA